MMTMIPKFYIERKGEEIKMIFPVPQRHEVKTYRKSPRKVYQTIEPVHTPWLSLPIGKETARALVDALKANHVEADVTIYDCDNWHMTVQAVG